MTPHDRTIAIARRIANGETIAAIAAELGWHPNSVYRALRRHRDAARANSAQRPAWSHPSPALLAMAHELRREILEAWHA